jgi:hypothetical protein
MWFPGTFKWFWNHVFGLTTLLLSITDKLNCKTTRLEWSKSISAIGNILYFIKEQLILIPQKIHLKNGCQWQRNRSSPTARKELIGLYSNKLHGAELNYTTIEKELLVIIKALRHFKSLILGAEIMAMTDHKNLTYITFTEDNWAQR